jgi:DNA-binding protein H-NS
MEVHPDSNNPQHGEFMTQSYSQIVRQIETLQRKANAARKKEVAGVVGRIKEAISFYNLTAGELGLSAGRSTVPAASRAGPPKRKKVSAKSKSKFGQVAKYRDAAGNEWVGRGPRPIWLREALKSGKSLADFAVAAAEAPAPSAKKAVRKTKTRRARKAVVAKYKDAASGKTWSGRGRKPGWFVNALAEGKSLESMAA